MTGDLASVPDERSFHAVDLRILRSAWSQQRDVVRGFIRTGGNTANWITPHRTEHRGARR